MPNTLDAFVPEIWANESVAILSENLVAVSLFHRDFSNEVANFGDIVNTRKPAEYTAKRKGVNDNVTVQDSSATNIAVPLDQHFHTSFLLRDGELSKSFMELRNTYLEPAVLSIAQAVDKLVLGEVYGFLGTQVGGLGTGSDTNIRARITNTRKAMNINKALFPREMIMTPNEEANALLLDLFLSAEKVGDDGTALREASIGRKLQFNHYMAQNTPSITSSQLKSSGALIDLTAGYPKGTTVVHVDTGGSGLSVGQWVTIGGFAHQITALGTLATEDIDVTIAPGLQAAVANDAPVTDYKTGLVNLLAGYAAGYDGEILVDGITGAIAEVGTLVTFAGNTTKYSVINFTNTAGNTTGITLNKPLAATIADDSVVGFGPNGEYNFAFHRNALSFVSRPLQAAPAGLALSAVSNFNNIGIRVTATYDGDKQGVLTTVDLLCGLKILDTALGAVMLG
jgi:hypothetical protein